MDLLWNLAFVLICWNVPLVAQLINKDSVAKHDNFTMTCNVGSFVDVPFWFSKITVTWIQISRRLDSTDEEEMVAKYPPLETKIPKNRKWEFKYRGRAGDFNSDPIELKWTLNDASCDDAGLYMCILRIYEWGHPIYATPFLLPGRVQTLKDGCPGYRASLSGAKSVQQNTIRIFHWCLLIISLILI